MGPRRNHLSGRSVARRRVLNQGRPIRLVPHTSDYSHIQVQGAEDDKGEVENQYPFIRKDSLQSEIEEEIAGTRRLNSSPTPPLRSPTSQSRPRTFAEATMSTWTRGRGYSTSKKGDSSNVNPSSSTNLESLGPFKYTFKKKKKPTKWSPFDLSGAGSEAGSRASSEVGSSRAASPNRQAPTLSQPQNSITVEAAETDASKGQEEVRDGGNFQEINTHQDQASTLRHPLPSSRPLINTSLHQLMCLDPIESDTSDTQSTKDRTEAAMAQLVGAFGSNRIRSVGEEAFDPLVWDPDLPTASADASPRSITATPQAVTYTTVGSLVNPNATPQFTAPNRIQREGSMRRPLIPLGQNRQYDSYLQPRGPPPALHMQSSINYTQPFSQSPLHYSQTPPSAAARSTHSGRFSTAKEQEMLRIQGSRDSKTLPKSTESPTTPTSANELASFGGDPFAPTINFKELTEDEEFNLTYNTQGPIQGLEKMQTLQRLAKFDNPMQELARNRLSEFSVAKLQTAGGSASSTTAAISLDMSLRDLREAVPVAPEVDKNLVSAGNLDHGCQFPSSITTSSFKTANPLFGAQNVTTTPTLRDHVPTRPTGYPQPLTAGPPGQRQYPGGSNKTSSNHLESLSNPEVRPLTFSPRRSFQATSPWTNQYKPNSNNQPDTHNYNVSQEAADLSKPLDTLPISAVLKYYPHGIPTGMTGNYNPLPVDIQKQMDQVSSKDEKVNLEEKRAKKARELDDWFYGGQRRYQMTAEDHIRELENRHKTNPFGPIGSSASKKFTGTERKPVSADEMEKMSTAEAAAPLLDASFGTLLAYADKSSASRAHLSRLGNSPAWQIDSSDKGNATFFGEDWGPPPKRIGRDPRYQPVFHNPSSTQWEY